MDSPNFDMLFRYENFMVTIRKNNKNYDYSNCDYCESESYRSIENNNLLILFFSSRKDLNGTFTASSFAHTTIMFCKFDFNTWQMFSEEENLDSNRIQMTCDMPFKCLKL